LSSRARGPLSSSTLENRAIRPLTRSPKAAKAFGPTGDAHYFLLTEKERIGLRLPRSAVRPVVTRARHLQTASITAAKWKQLLVAGERVWLFSPTTTVAKMTSVASYLRAGRAGACNIEGHKIQAREPWYRTRLPTRVDGFISGMSKKLPFLVMNGMRNLSATNTLYVIRFRPGVDSATRFAVGTTLLSSQIRRELAARARVYADGLLKFEPAELGELRVSLPERLSGARMAFGAATARLLTGDEAGASAIADKWLAASDNKDDEVSLPRNRLASLYPWDPQLVASRRASSA